MMATLKVNTGAMRAAAEAGFLNATDLADHLVRRGVPFREAHEVAGKLVGLCVATGRELGSVPLGEMRTVDSRIGDEVYEDLALGNVVGRRRSPGGTAPERVREQLSTLSQRRSTIESWHNAVAEPRP